MSNHKHSIFNSPQAATRYVAAEAITGAFARDLLHQAGLFAPITNFTKPSRTGSSAPLAILDNACGTGIVTSILYDTLTETQRDGMNVLCGDSSEHMIAYAQARITKKGWKGVETRIVDAMKTGLPSESFTHIVTNFGIMLLPDPLAALDECFRLLRPSGTCAFSTWLHPGWLPDVRAAFASIPNIPSFPTFEALLASWGLGSWHQVPYVEEQLQSHGFATDGKVEVSRKILTIKDAASFCDLFDPMLRHILGNFWTEEERTRDGERVKEGVREFLVGRYGEGREIEMEWVAILATGRKGP